MRKQIYLIYGTAKESYKDFQSRILKCINNLVLSDFIGPIRVTITTGPPPLISVIPFKAKKIAAISVFSDHDLGHAILMNEKGFSGMYNVEEALPVSYRKSWKDGDLTPGVCLLTLFRKKNNIDHTSFLDRWHNSHTPLSLRIHPLWHYNRNVVLTSSGETKVGWDGIVEEHFRTRSDLINPFLFFGNPLVILPNMLEVYRDTRMFLDYKTIEPYLVREYHIRS